MSPAKGPGIFISYRRDDTAWPARQIYDVVAHEFRADRVFKDVDNIAPGEDFVERIGSAVSSCDVLLVLIGPRWLSASDQRGSRRLDDPSDFVRLEIRTALQRNIEIIPIMVDETPMPGSQDLPPDIAPLSRRQGIGVSPVALDGKRLIMAVKAALDRQSKKALPPRTPLWSPVPSKPEPDPKPEPEPAGRPVRRPLIVAAAVVVTAVIAAIAVLVWGQRTPEAVVQRRSTPLPTAQALPADQMVVTVSEGGNPDLWVAKRSGGPPLRKLTSSAMADLSPNLSPDRRTVIYRQSRSTNDLDASHFRVVAVNATGDQPLFPTDPVPCENGRRGQSWNPADPTQLAISCATASGSVASLVRTDGEVLRPLKLPARHFGDLVFSPDGTHLAFWSAPRFPPRDTPLGGAISIVDLTTERVRSVTKTATSRDSDAVWTPRGDVLAFTRHDANIGNIDIMTVSVDGSLPKRRTWSGADDVYPNFSPDGRWIAYRSREEFESHPSGARLWLIELDTGVRRPMWSAEDEMNKYAHGRPAWTSR